jgi:16S rRNA (cytidine1402-2'-O)-methyltransferase
VAEPKRGILYIVATPIGNLGDFSFRAVEVLKKADLIACEDTRHSRPLLDHYGIARPLAALHEHNEDAAASRLLERLLKGETVAIVSDAGTPLISDPGFPLVKLAREAGIPVTPIPGPCAFVAALSAAGLPADRLAFEGFLPRKSQARKTRLEALRDDPRTLIFYESSHRVLETLRDLRAVFPAERRLVIARELTKLYETFTATTVGGAETLLEQEPDKVRGEFVLLVEGAPAPAVSADPTPEQERVLRLLLRECSVKTAVSLAVEMTGARRETLYRAALRLARGDGGS